jgi:hypothetical protein
MALAERTKRHEKSYVPSDRGDVIRLDSEVPMQEEDRRSPRRRLPHDREDTPHSRLAPRRSLGLLVVCACGASELIASTFRIFADSNSALLGRYMTDDAFYYFDIARRFPHISASPGVTTTGFHPLYWLTLVPIFSAMHGFAAVRAALVMLLVVHVVAGLLLYRLLCRSWSTWSSALVAVAWMASAGLRSVVLLGVETAWVELALIGLLLVCTSDRQTRATAPWVGAMLALCYLARNDSAIIAGAVVVAWLWSRRPDRRSIVLLAGTCALISLPWVVFLAVHNSLVATDSARALRASRQTQGLVTVFRKMAGLITSRTASLVLNRYIPQPGVGAALVLVGFSVAVVAAIIVVKKTVWSPYEIAMVASVTVLFIAYGLRLGGVRDWYLVYVNVALFVVLLPPLFEAVGRLLRDTVKSRRGRYAVASVGVALGVVASLVGPFGEHPQEGMKYMAAKAAAPQIGNARVGAFNSGIFTFVLDHAVVENLDGVVNPLVQRDLGGKTMCNYFGRRRLTWFLDDAQSARLLTRLGGPQGRPQVIVAGRSATLPAEVLLRVEPTQCRAGSRATGG